MLPGLYLGDVAPEDACRAGRGGQVAAGRGPLSERHKLACAQQSYLPARGWGDTWLSAFSKADSEGGGFPRAFSRGPRMLQATGMLGCVCSSEADEVPGAAAGRDQTRTGGDPPAQEQDADHGEVRAAALALGTAHRTAQESRHRCGSDLQRLGGRTGGWGLGQLSVGTGLCSASVGSSPSPRGPRRWPDDLAGLWLEEPLCGDPWPGGALAAPLLPSSTPSSPAAPPRLCSALLRAFLWADPPAQASEQPRLSP